MLKNINPLLSPDLLHALRSMGHRQDIAIVDANFPCDTSSTVIRLDGISATDVLAAVLSVLPLEAEESSSAWRMIAEGQPELMLPVFSDFASIIDSYAPGRSVTAVDPTLFKQMAKESYAVVLTGERRLYGGIIVRKGVISPDAHTG